MRVKDWKKFQHFKDRRPPWIKLYRDILDDPDWHSLDPFDAKVLVMVWLVASEYDGELPCIRKLAFRLRLPEDKIISTISRLSHWITQDDIPEISRRYQDDAPETEGEGETEGEKKRPRKRGPITVDTFLADCKAKGELPIPADDGVYKIAEERNIPDEFILLCWHEFKERMAARGKRYKNWRQAFQNCVRERWYRLWAFDGDGNCFLTADGRQAQNKYRRLG